MILLSRDRLRRILEHAETEKELVSLLRYHKIRFFWNDDGIPEKIPSRTGTVTIRRNRSRFEIHNVAPVPYNPHYMEV